MKSAFVVVNLAIGLVTVDVVVLDHPMVVVAVVAVEDEAVVTLAPRLGTVTVTMIVIGVIGMVHFIVNVLL